MLIDSRLHAVIQLSDFLAGDFFTLVTEDQGFVVEVRLLERRLEFVGDLSYLIGE